MFTIEYTCIKICEIMKYIAYTPEASDSVVAIRLETATSHLRQS